MLGTVDSAMAASQTTTKISCLQAIIELVLAGGWGLKKCFKGTVA